MQRSVSVIWPRIRVSRGHDLVGAAWALVGTQQKVAASYLRKLQLLPSSADLNPAERTSVLLSSSWGYQTTLAELNRSQLFKNKFQLAPT